VNYFRIRVKRLHLYTPIRFVADTLLRVEEAVATAYYSAFTRQGLMRYRRMQIRAYDGYTNSFEDAKRLCVGAFQEHERYPYEDYLMEHYKQPKDFALDFACGIGRMMSRMLRQFDYVAGVDLNARNLGYAVQYLSEQGWETQRYKLHQSDGVGVAITDGIKYNFIYSTIALQHIAVHAIRRKIISDLRGLLAKDGQCCFQMGFGWDNGVHWLDNRYAARSTNAGLDVCIPDHTHLPLIEKDLLSIGFSKVKFEIKDSPHPELNIGYHTNWIFIHLWV